MAVLRTLPVPLLGAQGRQNRPERAVHFGVKMLWSPVPFQYKYENQIGYSSESTSNLRSATW